jgi:hypothetical protein
MQGVYANWKRKRKSENKKTHQIAVIKTSMFMRTPRPVPASAPYPCETTTVSMRMNKKRTLDAHQIKKGKLMQINTKRPYS